MRTILLLAALFCIGCNNSAPPPGIPAPKPLIQLDVAKLQALETLDLRDLDIDTDPELKTFLAPLRHPINPKEIDLDLLATEPWHIWSYEERGFRSAWLIFKGKPLMEIPGGSSATVHFLDASGTIYKTIEFSTGWRIDLLSASFNYDSELQGYCIDVRSEDSINGQDIARQIYGVIDQRLALLWIENSKGDVLYHRGVGPSPPARSILEWEAALNSEQRLTVIETLSWLASAPELNLHETPAENRILDEPNLLLIYTLLQRSGVKQRLDELANSDILHIQKAAIAVLETYTEKPVPRSCREAHMSQASLND